MGRAVQSFASRFDWVLLGLVLGLAAVGITNLYSSSVALKESLHIAQSIWLALGLGLAGLTVAFDYRTYERWAYVIYGAALLLLIAVFFVGATINNSRRWLDLGAFLLQPSELIKLAMIITAARFFADFPKNDGYSLWDLRWLFALLGVPALLIMMQPDLGTSLVVIFITMTMILFQGVTLRSLLTMITGVVVGAPLFWLFGLKEYQKERILSFMDLEKDSYGAGWQVRQSLIAFGSGGLGGRGFLQGTQVQKGFVPYHESDFAAVNWAEEHGFLGMMLLLVLYFALIAWGVRVARYARDRYGMMLAIGVVALLFWHVSVNLGMVTGMLPVVGLTLPLVSYGGSSFTTTMLALGLLMNVSLRRHVM
jgi:rod shape determining protein RodA